MRFEDIQALLRPVLGRDVAPLYAEFREERGSNDSDEFLAWLHERGMLSHARFVQLLRWSDLSLTTVVGMTGRIVADPDEVTPGLKGLPKLHSAATASDHYAMLGTIGAGAMGRVLVAKDLDLHRKVAFKEMTEEVARNGVLVGRFLREVQITAQLDHPSIVPVYGLELTEDGSLGFAMKLIHGKEIADVIDECRQAIDEGVPLDDEHVLATRLEYMLKVCDALAYAHSRGVIHRDLKPANIMVGAYGEVYLMDWGVARLYREPDVGMDVTVHGELEEEIGAYTSTGQAIGTPAYMSPEQAEGENERLDPRSDIYSLGLVLYEAVSLRQPITGRTMFERLDRATEGEKDPLVHYGGQRIAPELRAVVDKATARDPHERYRSVEALAADLRRYLRGEAVSARRDPPVRAVRRWAGRHGTALLVTILLVLFGATAVVSGLVIQHLASRAHLEQAARAREDRLAALQAAVGHQREVVDREILHYESLLNGLAGAATQALTGPVPPRAATWLSADYDTAGRGPPDLRESPRYQQPISLAHPVLKLAPGVEAAAVTALRHRVALLADPLRLTALGSESDQALALDPAGQWELLGERGVPLVWMYVGLAEGLHTSYPGHGGYSPDYDPRTRPWYVAAAGDQGVRWGRPYVDASGHGLVLSCSRALYDRDNRLLGVAGADITLDHLLGELLELSQDIGEHEVFLVDEEGLVVASSSGGDPGAPFPVAGAFEAMRGRGSGHVEVAGAGSPILTVYSRLTSLGWFYAVVGDSHALMPHSSVSSGQ